MPHEVETMAYNLQRGLPWHGLGVAVDGEQDSESMLIAAGLDWAVRPSVVFDDEGREIPGYSANKRSSDGRVLGIVGSRYQIVQNREAFAFTDALIGGDVKYETAGSLSNGKRVWVLSHIGPMEILGDTIDQYVCFTNSHDGSSGVRVVVTPVRVVCANTLSMAIGQAKRSWTARHTMSVNSRMDEARRTLDLVGLYMKGMEAEARRLSSIRMTKDEWAKIVNGVFPMDQTDEDGEEVTARKMVNIKRSNEDLFLAMFDDTVGEHRLTGWGAVQATTDFEQHRVPARVTSKMQERRLEMVIDQGSMILPKVISAVNQLA